MWNAGTPEEGRESRLLRMGYRGLAGLCNLNPKSVKANLKSLEEKLAIERIGEFNAVDSTGRTYRIFSYGEVLARREGAGMLWVRKIKGVEFIPMAGSDPGMDTTPGVVSVGLGLVAQRRILEDPDASDEAKQGARRRLGLER